jgi:DNA polymerase III delta subunit
MSTTIQLGRTTLDKLKELKQEKGLQTYDAVIEYLIKKEHGAPDDLFGYMKGKMTPFTQDEEDSDHKL